jgi:hypothetical protein
MFASARLNPYFRTVAVGLTALYAPLIAAQSMTLTVPYRGATSMQAASTTIELDASSIAGGATISVDGTSVAVPASPCAGVACLGADSTPSGDDILVRRISGSNRAQLELAYSASFAAANYCAYTGPTSDKTFTVSLSGFTFGAGNGYRITSFMAPSDASCDIAYARVPGPRPSISGGSLTKLGRLPLNIVLALDKSPSMGWTIPGSADIRWDRLKASTQLFAAVWDVVGAPPPPGTVSSEGHPADRLGLLFFGGSTSDSPLDGLSFFKSRGVGVAPWSGPIATALADGSFIGGTSVGAGTARARTQLDTVDAVTGDTATVLFTDGEQNTPPCIIRQGETTTPTVKPYPGLPGVTYTDQCTVVAAAAPTALLTLNASILARDVLPRGPIFTIGLGEGGMAGSAVLLDEISGETAGRGRFPNDGPSMDNSFVDSLVDNLKGGTVSLLSRTAGSVPVGGASAPMAVAVDPSLTRVVFVLGWDGRGREVALEIRQPNGTVVSPALSQGTANSRVAAVNLPANGPAGTWQARVVHQGGGQTPFGYHLTAYGVESRLSARITESPRTGTGQPIKIVAEVGWDDGGLPDLKAGSIRAFIERPQENLGTILHQSEIREQQLRRETASSIMRDTSPLMFKIDQLATTGKLFSRIEPRAVPGSIALASVGQGRYEGSFDGTNVGGRYRIRVEFDWNDPRTGAIKRTHVAERQVPVQPTAGDSLVEVKRDPKTNVATVLVTPKDRFGNFVGPGHGNQFNVQVSGLKLPPASDPNVTGSYAFPLDGLAPGADPEVKINFRGQSIRSASLSKLEAAPPIKCGCMDVKCRAKRANAMASLGTLGGGVALAGLMAYWPLRRRRDNK